MKKKKKIIGRYLAKSRGVRETREKEGKAEGEELKGTSRDSKQRDISEQKKKEKKNNIEVPCENDWGKRARWRARPRARERKVRIPIRKKRNSKKKGKGKRKRKKKKNYKKAVKNGGK